MPKVIKNDDFWELKIALFLEKTENNENGDLCTSLKREAHFRGSEALKTRDFRDREGVKNEAPKKKDSGKYFG